MSARRSGRSVLVSDRPVSDMFALNLTDQNMSSERAAINYRVSVVKVSKFLLRHL